MLLGMGDIGFVGIVIVFEDVILMDKFVSLVVGCVVFFCLGLFVLCCLFLYVC